MANAIEAVNLTRNFGRKKVLDGVGLAVPTGGVFALLGENGAGKTTLIRTLLGYHRPQSGSVSVLGLDPARQPLEVRRRVGYVSDSHDQYEWMTVGEVGWLGTENCSAIGTVSSKRAWKRGARQSRSAPLIVRPGCQRFCQLSRRDSRFHPPGPIPGCLARAVHAGGGAEGEVVLHRDNDGVGD